MTTRHVNPTGYDPAEPCRPLSEVAWPADLPLIEPAWRTETVLGLAANIRDTKNITALPILADALEDAGCDNWFVLNHCRLGVNHHPHCWAVSAVLMKPRSSPPYVSIPSDTLTAGATFILSDAPETSAEPPVWAGGPAAERNPLTEMQRFTRDSRPTQFVNAVAAVGQWLFVIAVAGAVVASVVRYLYR